MRVPAGLTAIRGGIPRRVCFISPHGPLVLTVQGFGQQAALKWLRLHHDSFGNLTLSKGEAGQWTIYPSIEQSRIPKVNIASSAGLAETGAKTHRGRHFFGVNRGYRFLLFPSSLLRHLVATARPLSADPNQPQSTIATCPNPPEGEPRKREGTKFSRRNFIGSFFALSFVPSRLRGARSFRARKMLIPLPPTPSISEAAPLARSALPLPVSSRDRRAWDQPMPRWMASA